MAAHAPDNQRSNPVIRRRRFHRIRAETLADALHAGEPPADAKQVRAGDVTFWIWIERT